MANQYGRYTPMAHNTMNRNSAISSVRQSMNIPTPTAPRGHRQVPFGGKTETPNAMSPYDPNQQKSSVSVPEGPDPYQNQLAQVNKLQNRGGYGMEIPRNNVQASPPQGIYTRPQDSRRY